MIAKPHCTAESPEPQAQPFLSPGQRPGPGELDRSGHTNHLFAADGRRTFRLGRNSLA